MTRSIKTICQQSREKRSAANIKSSNNLDFQNWTSKQLRTVLNDLELPVKGTKIDLATRVNQACRQVGVKHLVEFTTSKGPKSMGGKKQKGGAGSEDDELEEYLSEDDELEEARSEDYDPVQRLIEEQVQRQGTSRKELKMLNLENKGIEILRPGVFEGLENLEELWLRDNRIRSLDSGVFAGLQKLAWLELTDNGIESLEPGVFAGLQNLEQLYLGGNKIGDLEPGVFAGLQNLEWLYLHKNQIESLEPGVFAGLQNLNKLSLMGNRIERLEPGVFEGLHNLYWLDLRNTGIEGLEPGVFAGLENLEELWLEDTPLTFNQPTIGALMELINYGKLRDFSFNLVELEGVEEISRYVNELAEEYRGKGIKAARRDY